MTKKKLSKARRKGVATKQASTPHATDEELSRFESEGGPPTTEPERGTGDASRRSRASRERE